ncbi:MAG TPA: hypothetical protein VJR92_13160 [Gemmatimonadaceae bacterium]|nr:hypothetical protein [Gemmatimonadaceae bacterium]
MRARTVARRTAVIACALAGCYDSTAGPALPSEAVYVRFPPDSMFIGQTAQIIAVATGPDSADVAWPQFAWTSSDTSVIIVDSTGAILGREAGAATIRAQFGEDADSVVVRVVMRDVSNGVAFERMSFGENALCALSSVGTAFCVPRNSASDELPQFEKLPGAQTVSLVSLAASTFHQCGLTQAGAMYCWGTNATGVFLAAVVASPTAPTIGGGAREFRALAAGSNPGVIRSASHTCAIESATRVVMCAGSNNAGQLGRPGGSDTTVAAVSNNLVAERISASERRTCAVSDVAEVWCWGGGGGSSSTPVKLSAASAVSSVYTADRSVCALTVPGELLCTTMGPNTGALAAGTPLTNVGGSLRFSSVISGTTLTPIFVGGVVSSPFTCGVTLDGDLYCWGDFPPIAVSSRLGDARFTPVRIAPGIKFRSIAANLYHLCGVTTDNKLRCQ